MFYHATKVTVIAEKILLDRLVKDLEHAGAKGYTIVNGSGKGEEFNRPGDRASVISDFSIVRIEFILADGDKARALAEQITEKFFSQYSGIIYISDVEVIRHERF